MTPSLIQLMTMHFLAHCASPATETLTELVAVIIREHYFIMLLAKMHGNIIYHHFDAIFPHWFWMKAKVYLVHHCNVVGCL